LPFASVDWETPAGTYSVSSISHSTKSPSRRSAVATHPPPAAKRAKRTPNATVEGKGSSLYDADDGGDKYDNDDDIIPATDGPMVTTAQDAADDMFIAEKAAELIEKHRQEFMKRAFSVRTLAADVPLPTASASIKMCRPQKDINYIIYTLKNWRVGVNTSLWSLVLKRRVFPSFEKQTTIVPSISSSMSLRILLFLDPTRLAQYSDGWRAALLAGLLYPERRCFTALMSGTEIMVTWVRRGLGGIARKNTGMLHRLLSSTTARPALLAEAWEWQSQSNRKVVNDDCVVARLYCDLCTRSGIPGILIPNSRYEHELRYSTKWYISGFIAGFAAVVQHDAHITTPKYKNTDHVLMVFTPYPNNPVNEILPYGSTTHFVSVVWNRQHYAVLYYYIDKRSVTVFDGLNHDIRKWQYHIIHTVNVTISLVDISVR
jgi:hypothetical protein